MRKRDLKQQRKIKIKQFKQQREINFRNSDINNMDIPIPTEVKNKFMKYATDIAHYEEMIRMEKERMKRKILANNLKKNINYSNYF